MNSFLQDTGLMLMTTIALIATSLPSAHGQSFTDPGFEDYPVSSGGFVKPTSGPWLFANDAGVVEPFATNSSTGPLNTWSAVFAPMQGNQYASTYAGSDDISQVVSFTTAGQYQISVYAAAPAGSVSINPPGRLTLGDGEFTFTLTNQPIGSLHTVAAGSDWALFSADFIIATPGDYRLGVRNTRAAPCFINYDAFALRRRPLPCFVEIGPPTNGSVRLRIEATTNYLCILEASTNLSEWFAVSTNVLPTDVFDLYDSAPPDDRCRFYRLKVPQ